jgi:hypothetical protein
MPTNTLMQSYFRCFVWDSNESRNALFVFLTGLDGQQFTQPFFQTLYNHGNKDSYDSLTLPYPPLFMYGSCLVATLKLILLPDPVISPLKLLPTLHSPAFT